MNYTVFYGGGEGPDVWDLEKTISAVDIFDALSQARGLIEDNGGWIFSVDQCDYPEESSRVRLQKSESELASLKAKLAEAEAISERDQRRAYELAKQMQEDRTELSTLRASLATAQAAVNKTRDEALPAIREGLTHISHRVIVEDLPAYVMALQDKSVELIAAVDYTLAALQTPSQGKGES